ncbi:glycosyltransferase family 9 protein, partial [Desulfovibrio sp. OttesenSCG-928-G15]|nr:glycosyltransferase family 9 protein [Desulfovibrio sp. OttesenSCG-928-G15]
MSEKPVLILQMQRMGDLVLSFPLLAWLAAANPARPIWVVGEEHFFKPLLTLSPTATYYSYDCLHDVEWHEFSAVLNLSHRPKAAILAGRARADILYGPWMDSEKQLFINGDWQLYRASLTQNNRFNRFHWSDLNALDIIGASKMRGTLWGSEHNQTPGAKNGRVGLFLGASEPDKHPDAAFWAQLAALLLKKGYKPVFLGGKAEEKLGNQAAHILGSYALNLVGRFSVNELASVLTELTLLVTPDTGPMHIASWVGTPVLNLSMGPVNPWETGPTAPGNHILRPALDCAGCWQCIHDKPVCKAIFTAEKVATLITRLFSTRRESALRNLDGVADGLELLRTGRDAHGLYTLERLYSSQAHKAGDQNREALSHFWHTWFGTLFGVYEKEMAASAAQEL